MRARSRPRRRKTAPDGSTEIHQQILVERDSQKAIMIGKGGAGSKKSAPPRARKSRSTSAARSISSCT